MAARRSLSKEITSAFLRGVNEMIVVTGATGQLGRLVLDHLLRRVPATELVAAVRDPGKAADLASRGVGVRRADYADRDSLDSAFAGAHKVLLVSSSAVGQRVTQHMAVIDAAKQAGVQQLAYTSVLAADTTKLALAAEHKATESLIRASGIPFTLLRNGWYTENYATPAERGLKTGAFVGSAGGGRLGAVPRNDYAQAAAEVLTGDGHLGKVYELAGDDVWSYAEFAAELTRQSHKTVTYKDLTPEEHLAALVAGGVPAAFAGMLVDSDRGIADGELASDSGHLRALLGRPTTSLAEAVAALLEELNRGA
jgi:NAD(P)H dehydrogenase (quinone)